MEYKHLTEIPKDIRQAYIREKAERIVHNKLLEQINYIKLLKGVKQNV
jgi:hypothetical protein